MFKGKKTYIGLAIALIGIFGISNIISPAEAETTIKLLFELVGIAIAVYGRIVTKAE